MVGRFFGAKEEDTFDDLVGEEQKSRTVPQSDKHSTKNSTSKSEITSHALVNGWLPIDQAPHNGMPCFVSNTSEGQGQLAYWKRTRAFANTTHRWMEYGKFVDFLTGMDIAFKPIFFKPRY